MRIESYQLFSGYVLVSFVMAACADVEPGSDQYDCAAPGNECPVGFMCTLGPAARHVCIQDDSTPPPRSASPPPAPLVQPDTGGGQFAPRPTIDLGEEPPPTGSIDPVEGGMVSAENSPENSPTDGGLHHPEDELEVGGQGNASMIEGSGGIQTVEDSTCGNGIVEGREECEIDETSSTVCEYGQQGCFICNEACQLVQGETAYCGDGIRNGREECDGGPDCDDQCIGTIAPCSQSAGGCPDLDWVTIEGGSYQMGNFSMGDPNLGFGREWPGSEFPAHLVEIKTYKLMRTEITVGMYRMCVQSGACTIPRTGEGSSWTAVPQGKENHPVVGISWKQINEFAGWVGARLPTEAEWEYAARSRGSDLTYAWGNTYPSCTLDCECAEAKWSGRGGPHHQNTVGCKFSAAVCSHPVGTTEQGICDMNGNAAEWVQDEWHPSYFMAPNDGRGWCDRGCPTNARHPQFDPNDESRRVFRGGSFIADFFNIRSFSRGSGPANVQPIAFGGRLARDAR